MIVNSSSKALQHNLAFTKKKSIVIPLIDLQFLDKCESVFGIHQRFNHFLNEYYHPYPNYQYIIDLFRQILLEDYWFYFNDSIYQEANSLFLKYIDDLICNLVAEPGEKLYENAKAFQLIDRFFQTLCSYLSYLYKQTADIKMIYNYIKYIEIMIYKCPILCSLNISLIYDLWGEFINEINIDNRFFKSLKEALFCSISYWNRCTDMVDWYERNIDIFKNRYIDLFNEISSLYFENWINKLQSIDSIDHLQQVPTFNEIAVHFRMQTKRLVTPFEQIYYIIYLLNHSCMKSLQRHLIYDINKIIRNISNNENQRDFVLFINNLFELLKSFKKLYPDTVMDCIASLGKELSEINNKKLIKVFNSKLIHFGFEFANDVKVLEDWQLQYNKNHIKNIRLYLELFSHSTTDFKDLLSALIIYLKIGGIFISDTDLFQKDVSKLLNSSIQKYFKLIKQLCRLFPIYFNEIGAEGELRDSSTELDELTNCKDIVIHFIRKQIHTESNNTHIKLIEQLMNYFEYIDIKMLAEVYPDHVMKQVVITEQDKVTKQFIKVLKEKYLYCKDDIFAISSQDLELAYLIDYEEIAKKRVILLIKIYKLLKEKYSFDSVNFIESIKKSNLFSNNDVSELSKLIKKNDNFSTVSYMLKLMEKLKKIILNKEFSEGYEDVYFKRHIAAGIPSMYGRYIEKKFDALGLTFRFEKITGIYIDKIIKSIQLQYITAGTLKRIYKVLTLINDGLQIDGIENESFNSQLKMLKYSLTSNTFSIDQYKNIFQFMQDSVKEIINEFFIRNFDPILKIILPVIYNDRGEDNLDDLKFHSYSEKFYRDLISSAFVIQSLDNFLSTILEAFNSMLVTFPSHLISQVMHYDPDKLVSNLDERNHRLDSQVFLGAKAYFLKQLKQKYFPIPDGFVLSTELFRYRQAILRHPAMSEDIDNIIKHQIALLEKKTNMKFGDCLNPLLLSVRSGAPLSMPGAMDTFLNIGLNDENTEKISRNPRFQWTIWDCYRRLIQSWGMSFGINRDEFDKLMLEFKQKWSVELKVNFTPEQIREIAMKYKVLLSDYDIYIEQDLYKQVRAAVKNVLNSWDIERAVVYRKQMEIADEWGTAVVIQRMAFGNISLKSGSGVLFTHDPNVNESGIHLNGDYTLCSQGEDVVGGLVHTRPISRHQVNNEEEKKLSLQNLFPYVYKQLYHYANLLIGHYGFNHQEIEFTFESANPEDLYILQTRNQVIQKPISKTLFADNQEFKLLAIGTGIGNDVVNGKIAFNMNDLKILKQQDPQCKRILIRPDTVPDDISLIFEAECIVTARGGITSHAAVTAVRLGKTGIVSCKSLKVYDNEKYCYFDNEKLSVGDNLAIDPNTGNIYLGHYQVEDY
ncbi:MAG: PEP-utilizing enzyme [Candidatus Cloacimonetes bacterium]|nr:PEP-utilizing enzyme [Candidatus Cloacimonadota bacterium]